MIMSEMCQKVSLECKTFVLYFVEIICYTWKYHAAYL